MQNTVGYNKVPTRSDKTLTYNWVLKVDTPYSKKATILVFFCLLEN